MSSVWVEEGGGLRDGGAERFRQDCVDCGRRRGLIECDRESGGHDFPGILVNKVGSSQCGGR